MSLYDDKLPAIKQYLLVHELPLTSLHWAELLCLIEPGLEPEQAMLAARAYSHVHRLYPVVAQIRRTRSTRRVDNVSVIEKGG